MPASDQKVIISMTNTAQSPPRVVLIGDPGVGKTSIVMHFLTGTAPETFPTTGVCYHSCQLQIDDQPIAFHVWDTAGQETYRAIGPMYYQGARAAIAVFDLTRPETLTNLTQWIASYRSHSGDDYVLVVGNKCDLDSKIQFTEDQTCEWALDKGFDWIWVSALSGLKIQDVFTAVARHLLEPARIDTTNVAIDGPGVGQNINESCC
jgi:small GTP-binding protein